MDGSLDDLLDDLEGKQKTMKKSESSSPVASQKTERKRDELTFDDEDDLMDALGFRETHKSNGNGATVKKERYVWEFFLPLDEINEKCCFSHQNITIQDTIINNNPVSID